MRDTVMIYGAYGYTGRLVAQRAVAQGLNVLLSGRNGQKLSLLAGELGVAHVALKLSDEGALVLALKDIGAVIHCAGPFSQTSRPMLKACLATGTHYMDITGEVGVLAACAALDTKAKAAGITVMPGCGFDVVPTDCLAGMLAAQLPDATRLELAFSGIARASRGTMLTGAQHVSAPVFHRKGGKLMPRNGSPIKMIDFGNGPERTFATSWGDIETAAHTTGIGNIEVFMKPSKEMEGTLRLPNFVRKLLATKLGTRIMRAKIARMPAGPDADERAQGRAIVTGTVWNDNGDQTSLRMQVAEPYDLTAKTAVEIAARVVSGIASVGFQTPAMAFGSSFILEFEHSKMLK